MINYMDIDYDTLKIGDRIRFRYRGRVTAGTVFDIQGYNYRLVFEDYNRKNIKKWFGQTPELMEKKSLKEEAKPLSHLKTSLIAILTLVCILAYVFNPALAKLLEVVISIVEYMPV